MNTKLTESAASLCPFTSAAGELIAQSRPQPTRPNVTHMGTHMGPNYFCPYAPRGAHVAWAAHIWVIRAWLYVGCQYMGTIWSPSGSRLYIITTLYMGMMGPINDRPT